MQQLLGWTASCILLATIATQIYRQWRAGTSQGVSRYLFIGQITASAAFSWYSFLTGDLVFIVTNLLMLVSAILGLGIVLWHRRRGK